MVKYDYPACFKYISLIKIIEKTTLARWSGTLLLRTVWQSIDRGKYKIIFKNKFCHWAKVILNLVVSQSFRNLKETAVCTPFIVLIMTTVVTRERRPSCFDTTRPTYNLLLTPVNNDLAEKLPDDLQVPWAHQDISPKWLNSTKPCSPPFCGRKYSQRVAISNSHESFEPMRNRQ